jgi:hypothetical protein
MARVFVSHRGSDTPEAERLAVELKSAGHVVFLDAWDLGVGNSIIGWMNESLGEASAVVLCLSKDTSEGRWWDREWMSSLNRQMNREGIRIYPVRLTGSHCPPILADIKVADCVADFDRGVRDLLRALA